MPRSSRRGDYVRAGVECLYLAELWETGTRGPSGDVLRREQRQENSMDKREYSEKEVTIRSVI